MAPIPPEMPMRYDLGRVYVRAVLTHEDYDRMSIEGAL